MVYIKFLVFFCMKFSGQNDGDICFLVWTSFKKSVGKIITFDQTVQFCCIIICFQMSIFFIKP